MPRRPSLADLPPPPPGRTGWPWTEATPAVGETRPDGHPWPRVSVVTPSYNQGQFIEETIRSVLLQGYPGLELIVVDGGSTDGTVEILRRYEPWIACWVSERDRGQTHAINKGLERATGDIFAYLNSDDLYAPGAVQRVSEAFLAHPGADVVHGECIYIDEAGEELFSMRGRAASFGEYLRIWNRFAKRDFLTQPEVFCRTAVVRSVGGFREELRSVMDFEMWLRLLARGCRFHPLDVPVAKFRTYVAQKSSVDPGYELCRVAEEYILNGPVPPAERLRLLEELEEAKAHLLVRGGVAATMLGAYGTALRYCSSAVLADPRILGTYSFWAVVGYPLRRCIPSRYRGALRELLAST